MQYNIDAAVVIYNADYAVLKNCINSLLRFIRFIYVVNNGDVFFESKFDKVLQTNEKIKIINLEYNMGIAYAQNLALKTAINNNADFVLLSDQDTVYPDNYLDNMLKVYEQISYKDKVAALVPNFKDVNNNNKSQGFIWFSGITVKKKFPVKGIYEVTQAIASGMLVNLRVLNEIGYMDERLFIDWVDLEWCWRARANGFKIIGAADINIIHTLGDFRKKFFKWEFPIRSPIRHYYIVRNSVFLALRSKYLTLPMRINLFFKSIFYIGIYTVLGDKTCLNFIFTVKGFLHGIIGKMNKIK